MARNFKGVLGQVDLLEREVLRLHHTDQPPNYDEIWDYVDFLTELVRRRGGTIRMVHDLIHASFAKKDVVTSVHWTGDETEFYLSIEPDHGERRISLKYESFQD